MRARWSATCRRCGGGGGGEVRGSITGVVFQIQIFIDGPECAESVCGGCVCLCTPQCTHRTPTTTTTHTHTTTTTHTCLTLTTWTLGVCSRVRGRHWGVLNRLVTDTCMRAPESLLWAMQNGRTGILIGDHVEVIWIHSAKRVSAKPMSCERRCSGGGGSGRGGWRARVRCCWCCCYWCCWC